MSLIVRSFCSGAKKMPDSLGNLLKEKIRNKLKGNQLKNYDLNLQIDLGGEVNLKSKLPVVELIYKTCLIGGVFGGVAYYSSILEKNDTDIERIRAKEERDQKRFEEEMLNLRLTNERLRIEIEKLKLDLLKPSPIK